MRKGVIIFLGALVACLMLTTFLSAVNSEIIIARNAALVVASQPVIASDTTISALEPEQYDSMINSFQADNDAVIAESNQTNDLPDSSEAGLEQALPDGPVVKEPDGNTVFTVQAGSYTYRFNAENKYKSLIHDMDAADLDQLRIEKVGDYYTVRLRRFDHYATAMKFLNAMNSRLSSAIVLEAYIKNERIVALHDNALLAGK